MTPAPHFFTCLLLSATLTSADADPPLQLTPEQQEQIAAVVGQDALTPTQAADLARQLAQTPGIGEFLATQELRRRLATATPEEADRLIDAHMASAGAGTGAASGSGITLVNGSGEDAITYHISSSDGQARLTAKRAGKVLFQGPVTTPEQRAQIPEELLTGPNGLGQDFDLSHAIDEGGIRIRVHSGGAGLPDAPAQ
jgi:hypothetical protein